MPASTRPAVEWRSQIAEGEDARSAGAMARTYPAYFANFRFRPTSAEPVTFSYDLSELWAQARHESEADLHSSEPSFFWQTNSIPNFQTYMTILSDDGESALWELQVYTVSRGTNVSKRIVKARRCTSTAETNGDPVPVNVFKAFAFLNRDGSITTWNSSPWRHQDDLHRATADLLRDRVVRMGRQPHAVGQSTFRILIAPGRGFSYSLANFRITCRVCNATVNGGSGNSQFCNTHAPAPNRTLVGDSPVYTSDSIIYRWENAGYRSAFPLDVEGVRMTANACNYSGVSVRNLPIGVSFNELDSRLSDAHERRERRVQARTEQRQAADQHRNELLSNFSPLLSENQTGLIR